jgi:hypothetical protein
MTITITIPGVTVPRWNNASDAAHDFAPLVTALLLPLLEEALPGLGLILALAQFTGFTISTRNV